MSAYEVQVPVHVLIDRPPPEERENGNTDYAEQLRNRIGDVHDRARNKLKLSGTRQAKTYDRNTVLIGYAVGDWVRLSGIQRKKGVCPKLVYKWEGPYLVMNKLSDVVYRIQKSQKGKLKVIHVDRLKMYPGPPLRSSTGMWKTRGDVTPQGISVFPRGLLMSNWMDRNI